MNDIINNSVVVIDHIYYSAYGNLTSESNPSNGDRFKFDGMVMDSSIGLYEDNAKYYNSTIGIFESQDPMGFQAHDTNLYRFTSNSPTDFIDPTGDLANSTWGYIGGMIVGGVITVGAVALAPIEVPILVGTGVIIGGTRLAGEVGE